MKYIITVIKQQSPYYDDGKQEVMTFMKYKGRKEDNLLQYNTILKQTDIDYGISVSQMTTDMFHLS